MSNIIRVGGGAGGSQPVLITKNITQNGTYNASSDSADGYSSVTVNVAGGGSVLDTKITSAGTYFDYDNWECYDASATNFKYIHSDYFLENGVITPEIYAYCKVGSGYEGFCFPCSSEYTLVDGNNYIFSFVLDIENTVTWQSGYQFGIKWSSTKITNFNTTADQSFTRQTGRQNVSFPFTAGSDNYFAILASSLSASGAFRLIDPKIEPAT